MFPIEVAGINEDYKFSTALGPNLILLSSAKWKVIGKKKDAAVPIVTKSTIKDYQKAKYARGKGGTERSADYSFREEECL